MAMEPDPIALQSMIRKEQNPEKAFPHALQDHALQDGDRFSSKPNKRGMRSLGDHAQTHAQTIG